MTTPTEDNTTPNLGDATSQRRRIRCSIESGIWRLVAGALFKDKRSRMRELISNCIDAIHKRQEKEPNAPRMIKIYYTPEGDLIIEDWGTGILDLHRFTRIAVPSYHNVNRSAKDIGFFGVGKTSFVLMSATERVIFISVNYENGMILDLGPDENDELTYSEPIHRDRAELLDHQGVKTIIKDLNKKDRMPPQELADYIGEQFMPLINFQGFEILIFDEKGNKFVATPPQGFSPPDKDPLYVMDEGTPVTGKLKKGKGDKCWIYRKGVLITDPLHLGYRTDDMSYLLIDSPKPPIEIMTAGRDSLQTDTEHYLDIVAKSVQYCKSHGFQKIEIDMNVTKKGESAFHRTMTQIMENYLKRHNDTPPPFLKKVHEELLKQEDDRLKKKLTKERQKRGKKGKTTKPGNKTGRKNKRHQHWIKDENSPGNNGPGKTGLFITFVPVSKGKDGDPSIKYSNSAQLFNINVDRPSGKKVMAEQHSQTGFSQGTRQFMTMGMVDAFPSNENITPQEFQKKYYDTVDEDLGDK